MEMGQSGREKELVLCMTQCAFFFFLFFLFQILYFIIFCLFSMHLTQTSELPSSGNFFELEVQLKPQLL